MLCGVYEFVIRERITEHISVEGQTVKPQVFAVAGKSSGIVQAVLFSLVVPPHSLTTTI